MTQKKLNILQLKRIYYKLSILRLKRKVSYRQKKTIL